MFPFDDVIILRVCWNWVNATEHIDDKGNSEYCRWPKWILDHILNHERHISHRSQPVGCIFVTHWGRVTHICVINLSIIGSDNGLSHGRRQASIWTSAGLLLIGLLGTNFSEILIEIYIFSFKKLHLKMSSGKMAAILSRPQCVKYCIDNCPCYDYKNAALTVSIKNTNSLQIRTKNK